MIDEYLNTSGFRKIVCNLKEEFEIGITSSGIPKFVALSPSKYKKFMEKVDEMSKIHETNLDNFYKDFESINISSFRKELCHLDGNKYYRVENNKKPCIYIYPFLEKEKLSESLALLQLLAFSKKDIEEGRVYTSEEMFAEMERRHKSLKK